MKKRGETDLPTISVAVSGTKKELPKSHKIWTIVYQVSSLNLYGFAIIIEGVILIFKYLIPLKIIAALSKKHRSAALLVTCHLGT